MVSSKLLVVGALALLLAGCPKGGTRITCPPLTEYPTAKLQRALAQWETVEIAAPDLSDLIDDYFKQRKAVKKCLELRAKAYGKKK
jgi:hypothetical protein